MSQPRTIQPYIFKANLIWWGGLCKIKVNCLAGQKFDLMKRTISSERRQTESYAYYRKVIIRDNIVNQGTITQDFFNLDPSPHVCSLLNKTHLFLPLFISDENLNLWLPGESDSAVWATHKKPWLCGVGNTAKAVKI